MSVAQTRRSNVGVPLILGLAAVVVVVAVSQSGSDDAPVRRAIKEASEVIQTLPVRLEQIKREARERFDLAKAAFYQARAESERALTSQLQEAKQRGSVPPS